MICLSTWRREERITAFLFLTMLFMVVELGYGFAVNSLGLVTDAFHMLFDAISLVIGLSASHASRFQPNDDNPFGYARYELIASFVNSVLLLFVAVHIFFEAIQRLITSPEIEGPYLLTIAVGGLVVNIIGVYLFHDFWAAHDHDSCVKCDNNLRGIYLHILGDLLGSVSVIVSSIALSFGFSFADPLCTAFVAVLIFRSSVCLLFDAGKVLLLSGNLNAELSTLLYSKISKVDCLDVEPPLVWVHSTPPHQLVFCVVTGKLADLSVRDTCADEVTEIVRHFCVSAMGCPSRIVVHLE